MDLNIPVIAQRFDYPSFVTFLQELVASHKTTGPNQSADFIDYTRQNLQRTTRIYKTTEIEPALVAVVAGLERRYRWLVFAEAWCGDVFQTLPVIAKLAELSKNVSLEIILRDENAELMDHFTTEGGRAIPIFVVIDAENDKFIQRWGPRPAPAQAMVRAYKALTVDKPPYMEFVNELQLWYAHDRTRTLQSELLAFLGQLEH